MMMVPYMFNDGLMDNLFSNEWEHDFERAMRAAEPRNVVGKHAVNVMKTDVRENKDSYDVFVDLPGFKKEDIKLDLENGYLTISAAKGLDKDVPRLLQWRSSPWGLGKARKGYTDMILSHSC